MNTKLSLERVSVRTRESGVTHSGWRMEILSDDGKGAITLIEAGGRPLFRGEGIFLGTSQEDLAAVYNTLNAPPDDEPAFELQHLG